MRFIEFRSGIQTIIFNEEQELIEMFNNCSIINKKDLTERQQQVMSGLVSKSIIIRKNQDGQITFKKANTF
jgi:hypothetical protein